MSVFLSSNILVTPGEHAITFQGPVGLIEAIVTVPENPRLEYVAFLGHPHSLQGGTMQNKVVTTLARLFRDLRIPSVRINFRGVGRTEGQFDHGIGESEDMLHCIAAYQMHIAGLVDSVQLVFAGFSFGSYVMSRVASQLDGVALILVAPPIERFDYHLNMLDKRIKVIVVQGEADEVVEPSCVYHWVLQQNFSIDIIRFSETGHFFHGKLLDLKREVLEYLPESLKNI